MDATTLDDHGGAGGALRDRTGPVGFAVHEDEDEPGFPGGMTADPDNCARCGGALEPHNRGETATCDACAVDQLAHAAALAAARVSESDAVALFAEIMREVEDTMNGKPRNA